MDAFTAGRYCPPWMNCVGRSIPCACTTSMQLANLASYTCLLLICCYTLLRCPCPALLPPLLLLLLLVLLQTTCQAQYASLEAVR